MNVTQSALEDDTVRDERSFFNELRGDHAAFGPVLGSGMSRAPRFGELVRHLLERGAETDIALSVTAADPPFGVVDELADRFRESWLQEQTAALYRDRPLRPTPALEV